MSFEPTIFKKEEECFTLSVPLKTNTCSKKRKCDNVNHVVWLFKEINESEANQ